MKSERVFPSTPTARSMRERCSGRARRLIAASACRKYHNWHYFTIPTAHSYKTIQSAPAPMRRHTPKPPRPRRFANAPQTNTQTAARHAPAPKRTTTNGKGRAPVREPNRCPTRSYPACSSFRHLPPPVFLSLHNANYGTFAARVRWSVVAVCAAGWLASGAYVHHLTGEKYVGATNRGCGQCR